MSGISIRVEFNDSGIRAKLQQLVTLGRDPSEVLGVIANYGETSTRRRFEMQSGPGGKRWEPSLRVKLHGGKTLVQLATLRDSIRHRSSREGAEWGTDTSSEKYAAIHQFGGNAGRGLRSKIVPRPFLGINTEDEGYIMRKLQRAIEGTL